MALYLVSPDYTLVRSLRDQHVMTSFHNSYDSYRRLIDNCRTYDALAALIKALTPGAFITNAFVSTSECPSLRVASLLEPYGLSAIEEKFGLPKHEAVGKMVREGLGGPADIRFLAAVPPEEVHSMQRGANWIGDFYSADMLVSSLESVGERIKPGTQFLDLGCSSGSMLRVLSWAYPLTQFIGVDPVKASIDWATSNLVKENLVFRQQDQVPPLPISSDSVDYVSAISIFSHHGLAAAAKWFQEVRRILKPNGIFLMTTHGTGSLLHYVAKKLKPVERYSEIYCCLLTTGFAFEETWLDHDDVGNIATDVEWGNSFYDQKVLYSELFKEFDILHFGSRTNQDNQDLYLLRKKSADSSEAY